jgi:Sec-independent protein translocase protein TatA
MKLSGEARDTTTRSAGWLSLLVVVLKTLVMKWMLLCSISWQPNIAHSFSLCYPLNNNHRFVPSASSTSYPSCWKTNANTYHHIVSSSSFCSRCSVRSRLMTGRRAENARRSSTSLTMFLGQDAGFLGVGAPEIATIVLVGYFVLGPTELYKLVKDIGKFVTNIRTAGAEATASFEGAMENQLALNEIRKAQVELSDAFSFRRSINTAEIEQQKQQQQQQERSNDIDQRETTETTSNIELPKKKKRRRLKRKISTIEDLDMMDEDYPVMGSSPTMTSETLEESPEERKIRLERLARLEASLEESDRLWEKRVQEMEEQESKFGGEVQDERSFVTAQQQQSTTQPSSRFLSQLSPEWNQNVISNEDKLQPLAKIMEQLALLEEEREATMKRLEEEYRRKNETETLFYEKKRDLLKSAASDIQQHLTASSET